MVTNIHQRIVRALRRFGPKRLKAFRPLGITPQELESMLFDPSLR